MNIFTIGHFTHRKEEFVSLLQAACVDKLIDVRSFPGSRKFPHFHKDEMEKWLPENGVRYVHLPLLGGRRNKSKDTDSLINDGWQNQSFHNYADFTLHNEFLEGIEQLKEETAENRVAICCSERHPARCHRLLISNWLAAHGQPVCHIIDGPKGEAVLEEHVVGKWGAPAQFACDGSIVYPIG